MDLGTTKMIARTEGGIGWMIFNQPEKHNAVSYEMWLAVPKIIAAFEGRYHPSSGMPVGDFEESPGSPRVVGFFQEKLREGVAAVRVEPGRDQHHLGPELIECRQQHAQHAVAKMRRARHRR